MATKITNDHHNHNNKKKGVLVAVKEEEEEKEKSADMLKTASCSSEKDDEYMSREEVVKRRCKRLKQLSHIYTQYYWSLVEQLKLKHNHFVWQFGTTPLVIYDHRDEEEDSNNDRNTTITTTTTNNNNNCNCEMHSCKKKAMALTRFCHSHILSDANQVLYKGCNYPTKCSPSGPTLCMKPILRSAVPSLCSDHLEKAEKHLSRCLRKEGFTGSISNRHPLKLNVIIAEFVHQIQSHRRESL